MSIESVNSLRDGLSVIPIVQQFVGIETIISAIINIWREHRGIQESEERFKSTRNGCIATRRFTRNNRKAQEAQERIKQYQQEIGIGLIRMIPIVGTIYSIYRWQKDL